MKKLHFFIIFAVIFSFSFVFFNFNTVKADGEYSIKITTDAVCTKDTNLDLNYFNIGYSQNNIIKFSAKVFEGNTELDANDLTYNWYVFNTETVVCSNPVFTLKKDFSENLQEIIMLGEKKYTLKVSGTNFNKNVDFSIDVIDDSSHEIILTKLNRSLETNDQGAYVVTNKTSKFTIQALLAKSKVDCTINWYLKTPNSSTYDLMVINGDFVVDPSKIITSENGFGTYKIYASAQSSSVLFTSKIIYLEAVAGELSTDLAKYTINKTVIKNSKTELEAFTFSLNNATEDGLDYNRIVWFLNSKKVAIGQNFSYEPTTSEAFVVSVQYQNANLVFLDETQTTPRTTGTLKFVLYISGVVALLSIIFAISVRRLNKKRDVVW